MDEQKKQSHPLAELLHLAAPTVAQMASYTLMQFIDTWILAHAGTGVAAPTAASNAGILSFAVISLGMGVLFVVNTLVSQSFGRKDYPACGQFLWQGIWFSVVFWLLLLPLLFVLPNVFLGVKHEPALAHLEGIYLQIVLGASILKLATTVLEQFFLGVNRPGAVAIATFGGVAINAAAAWILIMGRLGLRPMGVTGSAIAQNIGVGVEGLIVLLFLSSATLRKTYGLRAWRMNPSQMWTLIKVGVPSGIQIVADILAWSVFMMWVMGVFHTEAMAANIFVFRYMSVSFMPAYGISVAVTALVGRYIGMGRPDIAAARANLGFAVAGLYMLACGALFFLYRRTLMMLFTDDPQVLVIGQRLLIFAAVYQLFDAMYIIYNGALRGAGDTLMPAIATAVLCWGMTIFGGYAIARTWPQLGPTGPWLAATAYGITLGAFIWLRFARGRWKSINLQSGASPSLENSTKLSPVP
jgi:MATE family multidrug resistance protein